MAEMVFQNLEGMISELEDLQHKGVFKEEELAVIIKRRTDFEYKLQKRIVEKEDFLGYLEYELKLDQLRRKREKNMKLKHFSTSSLAVTKRIHSLFQKALLKFGNDKSLWMQYIEFCKKTNSMKLIGEAFGRLLQHHGNIPDLWIMVAKYDFENNNIDNARMVLLKGLRKLKESKQLWYEYFKLELLHVQKIKKRQNLLGVKGIDLKDDTNPKRLGEFLQNQTAQIVYQNSVKQIAGDIDFQKGFLDICSLFQDVEELENFIAADIEDAFPGHEEVFAFSATKQLRNLKKKNYEIIVVDQDWLAAEKNCIEKFEEAINQKNTPVMWELYLQVFLSLLTESKSPDQAKRCFKKALEILNDCYTKDKSTESMFILWSDLLEYTGNLDEQLKCLEKGLKCFENSSILLKKYLILNTKLSSSYDDLNCCFSKVMKNCQVNIEIWQIFSNAFQYASPDQLQIFFARLMTTSSEIRDQILPKCLNEIHKKEGMKAVRKLYKELLKEKISVGIFKKCIELEINANKPKVCHIRNLYEKATEDYGKSNPDIWISYLLFEKKQADIDYQKISQIFSKAKRMISEEYLPEFLNKYTLM